MRGKSPPRSNRFAFYATPSTGHIPVTPLILVPPLCLVPFEFYFTTMTFRVSSIPLPDTRTKYNPRATGFPALFFPSQ